VPGPAGVRPEGARPPPPHQTTIVASLWLMAAEPRCWAAGGGAQTARGGICQSRESGLTTDADAGRWRPGELGLENGHCPADSSISG